VYIMVMDGEGGFLRRVDRQRCVRVCRRGAMMYICRVRRMASGDSICCFDASVHLDSSFRVKRERWMPA